MAEPELSLEPKIKLNHPIHCLSVCIKYLRNERRLLFFNFLLLFIPALEGDSSLAFGWLETFEEFCWLKCVGTWRASPP